MPQLYSAILNPSGPNYIDWQSIFGVGSKVPLKSPRSSYAQIGIENNVEVYMLDLEALTLGQRARLLSALSRRFKTPIYEVEKEIATTGFPIRAVDVIVTYDTRAFV